MKHRNLSRNTGRSQKGADFSLAEARGIGIPTDDEKAVELFQIARGGHYIDDPGSCHGLKGHGDRIECREGRVAHVTDAGGSPGELRIGSLFDVPG